MIWWRDFAEWRRLIRYYQAGLVNLGFGYGAFALLITAGSNIYLAQAISHIAGMTFNYFTYSNYTFSDHDASRYWFLLSYALNYGLNLVCLVLLRPVISSPYFAGLVVSILVSIVNYVLLKKLVYKRRTP